MQATPSRVELSPLNFLKRAADTMGERTAVVHGERRYTYAQLQERCNRLASGLWNRGIERNDRVAVLCPNTPALLEAHYGVPTAGAILVAINTRLSTGEVAYIVEDSGAKLLIIDDELQKMIEGVDLKGIETIVVQDTGEEDDPYEQLLASGSPEPRETYLQDEQDPISINYTSGTTGKSKGAVYTHRGAYLQATGVAHETRLNYESVHLWTLPMFHCNGWCLTWGVTAAAATHVCLRKVVPDLIWDLFDAEGVTHYSGAPTIHMSIVNHEKAHPLEQRVTVPTGGSPPSPALLKAMREVNLHPIHLYGLTETYGPIMACSWHPEWDENGYVELRDRAKDIIISGGENISSIEVEQVLAEHPAVYEVAVVATPDDKWGERPKAFVELKDGKEITAFGKEHLARFKVPSVVEFGELPRTSTGKVQKFILRNKEWEGREKAIGLTTPTPPPKQPPGRRGGGSRPRAAAPR